MKNLMEYLEICHLSKWNPQNLINYSTNMCWCGQGTRVKGLGRLSTSGLCYHYHKSGANGGGSHYLKYACSGWMLIKGNLGSTQFNQGPTLETRGVSHCGLAFTLKSILRWKKNYENSNISPCKNIIFKKSSKVNQNPSRYYNFITNLKFQHKPKHHLSKILI
jgi:hypothetical protein